MRLSLPFLSLLAGLALPTRAEECNPNKSYVASPYNGETTKDPEISKRIAAYWSKSTCYKTSDNQEPSLKEQCKDICVPGTDASRDSPLGASTSCNFDHAAWIDAKSGNALLCGTDKDFKGKKMMTGYCQCDLAILDIAGKFFIDGVTEAGKILEKVICPALQALDIVIAVGTAALPPPGKAITGGMIAAVRSAKAYKYAYEAQDAAQEWADFFLGGMNFGGQAGCPSLIKPSKQDLIAKAFQPLVDATDSMLPECMNYDSLPCPAQGCRGCKGPKCRDDNKHDDDKPSKTGIQPIQTSKASTQMAASTPVKTTGSQLNPSNAVIASKWSTVSMPTSQSVSTAASLFVSASSSSSVVVRPTLSCEAIAALDEPELDASNGTLRRSYPIDLRSYHLERRGDKHGQACGIVLRSFAYPASGSWMREVGRKPKQFGYNHKDSCDNYDWDKPDPSSEWETEHVLEWQIVVAFFNQMNQDIKKDFIHPDPDRNGDKVDFCEYWRESWAFDLQYYQVMADPQAKVSPKPISVSVLSTQAVSLSVSSTQPISQIKPSTTPKPAPKTPKIRDGTPFGWLASQYPHVRKRLGSKWVEEFTLLEKVLNGQYKGKIFGQKDKDGKTVSIRAANTMDTLIQGNAKGKWTGKSAYDQGRAVIQSMRNVIGVFIYMQDKDVAESFAKEKNRMGKMIGAIDKELHKTPRIYYPQQRVAIPWKEQGLEDKWNKYMDDVFDGAKDKSTKHMDKYLNAMKKEWDSQKKKDEFKKKPGDNAQIKSEKDALEKDQKDVLALIEKTGKEWDKVKNWQKPANWVSKP